MSPDTFSAAALMQQRLWGTDPQGWALFGEPHNRPLFEAVLDAAAIGPGSAVLDVGCGTGLALHLATGRGARTTGVDIVEGMLELAARAEPTADLRHADLESLPFADATFDAVISINALQFAGDPELALAEAARVCVPGGIVVASFFAEPERSQTTEVHHALAALSPPQRESDHAPYALSAPGNYEMALGPSGLTFRDSGEVTCVWDYPSTDDAVRGMLSSAGGTRAVEDAGRELVSTTIRSAVAPFTDPAGVVRMTAVFRWVSAVRSIQ